MLQIDFSPFHAIIFLIPNYVKFASAQRGLRLSWCYMKIYDISIPISAQIPTYPGDSPVSIIPVAQIAKGDAFNISYLSLSSHTGTHIDAPCHLLEKGDTVDMLPLDVLIGKARVYEFESVDSISAADLDVTNIPPDTERILLKTRNSQLWRQSLFHPDFVYIQPDAARWMVEHDIKLVGIDYLSVERFGASPATAHLTLLGAGIVIIEGLDLSDVPAGEYTLVCLPLKVEGGDGAPARAVLLERKE